MKTLFQMPNICIRSRLQPSLQRRPGAGFTIIELITVISLIAMLIAILFGAAQYVVKSARKQRANVTARVLEVAVASYRHEYGHWPLPDDSTGDNLETTLSTMSGQAAATNSDANWIAIKTNNSFTVAFTNMANYLVFDRMRAITNNTAGPAENPNNIRFVDDGAVYVINNGQRVLRYTLPSSTDISGSLKTGFPIAYMTSDGTNAYFGITIDFVQDTVTIPLPYP